MTGLQLSCSLKLLAVAWVKILWAFFSFFLQSQGMKQNQYSHLKDSRENPTRILMHPCLHLLLGIYLVLSSAIFLSRTRVGCCSSYSFWTCHSCHSIRHTAGDPHFKTLRDSGAAPSLGKILGIDFIKSLSRFEETVQAIYNRISTGYLQQNKKHMHHVK